MKQLVDHSIRALRGTESFLGRWGFFLLFLFGVGYYSLFLNMGLNLGGEGGTNAVLAQRLMEGYRPIEDTFLGYNLLWFYPLVWLFEWTGVNYLAMRGFFFAVCIVTALLGALTVLRLGKSHLLAFLCGLTLLLIPGMMFRNYMGLMGVANQLAMLSAFLLPVAGKAWLRIALIGLSGLVLGLTFLIRIEIGLLMVPIWLGLIVLYPLWKGEFFGRLKVLALGLPLALLLLAATHVPPAMDAAKRDYSSAFWEQYSGFVHYMEYLWREQMRTMGASRQGGEAGAAPLFDREFIRVVEGGTDAGVPEAPVEIWRPRPPVMEMFTGIGQRERYFAASVYLPCLFVLLLVTGATATFFRAFFVGSIQLRNDALAVLVLTGCSLTLFPQYFFFRPDTPHITEFMAPFIVTVFGTFALALCRCIEHPGRLRIATAAASAILCGVMVWIHFGHAFPKESAGTIAARIPNGAEFRALNGVHVVIEEDRAEGLHDLLDAVVSHSAPDDWVICVPYSPTINLMTARRSYLWNLYMDDSNRDETFQNWQVQQIQEKRPAVIVIDHRAINQTEESRFRNWAHILYGFIVENYELLGEFADNEVFVLPDGQPLDGVEEI